MVFSKPSISLVNDDTPLALEIARTLKQCYSFCDVKEANILVTLGGDGFMLKTLHQYPEKAIYGMNCGTVGFLMNKLNLESLFERIEQSQTVHLYPLKMVAHTKEGTHTALAINEISLLRSSRQTAKLRIFIDQKMRLEELVCDGLILSTPAGSTAYNFSVNGPILPLKCPLLALTPISPFRPPRWRGALLPDTALLTIEVLNPEKRPVNAVADHTEIKNIHKIDMFSEHVPKLTLLFDEDCHLEERIFAEQFLY
jgi:NAD+ kinase